MDLAELVACSQAVAATRSRKKKIAALATLLRGARGDEIDIAVTFLSGSMRQGRIGLGYAAASRVTAPPAPGSSLTVREVDRTFGAIAGEAGAGSNGRRTEHLGRLLARATEPEQRLIKGLVVGEIRQGALEGILIEAVAAAADAPAAAVRRAVMLHGELAGVARAVLEEGPPALSRFALEVGRPIQPMLAATCNGAEEAVAQLGETVLDFKIDGARVQVHKDGDEVAVFSRRLKPVTPAVPELVALVRALPVTTAVLDGEVIALRPDGLPHPFQTTMRRFGRKLDVAKRRAELPLTSYFFDCLYADGALMIDAPARARFARMADMLPAAQIIRRRITTDPEDAEAFYDEALAAGHEGLMAKALGSVYAAGSRGSDWLKIKPAHTLDLVVLAAEWGSGRRRGWLSNLHLGARNVADGGFTMLGKTFKGLTDERLTWQTEALLRRELGREGHVVHVRPELVVEIAVSDIQTSPHYPGGLALRFARVKRYRPDKTPADADTLETVRRLHRGGHRERKG
ncbi:MAG: ATP-dependent DNA ligase [Myxococcota bacterium]